MRNLLYHLAAETRRPIIIEMLFDRANVKTLQGLATNPKLSSEQLQDIFTNPLQNNSIDGCLARHHNTPPTILAQLSASPIGWVVEEVVKNPSTPKPILMDIINRNSHLDSQIVNALSNHSDPEIREEADRWIRDANNNGFRKIDPAFWGATP